MGRLRLPTEGLRQGHGLARNDVWLMVWEDWAEILRANAGRAMLNRGRHNAQCLPVWKQSGPTLSVGCAQVGPMLSHLGLILGLCWAKSGPHLGPMLRQVGPMLSYVGPILAPCWAYVGLCWAYVGPC